MFPSLIKSIYRLCVYEDLKGVNHAEVVPSKVKSFAPSKLVALFTSILSKVQDDEPFPPIGVSPE